MSALKRLKIIYGIYIGNLHIINIKKEARIFGPLLEWFYI